MYPYLIKEGESLREASERYGVNYSTFKNRIAKMRKEGINIYVEEPVAVDAPEFYVLVNETITQAAKRHGMARSTFVRRLHQQGNYENRYVIVDGNVVESEPQEEPKIEYKYDWLMTSAFVTIHRLGGNNPAVRTFKSTDPQYKEIEQLVSDSGNGVVDFGRYFNDAKIATIKIEVDTDVSISKDGVFIGDKKMDDDFARMVFDMEAGKIDKDSKIAKFIVFLAKNPSKRIQENLYKFMQHNDIVINEDGMVVCYKKVDNGFRDIYSGKFDNSVGNTVEMPRSGVNDDASATCSHGLHVAALSYMEHYSFAKDDVVVEVLVNPADFVAIPHDYNFAKARVCKYYVNRVYSKGM